MGYDNTQFPEPTFLEKIDIFGIGIAIRFNHSPSHNTKIGGIVTVSILAIIFFQLISVLQGLFKQNEPSVIYSDDYVKQAEPFYLRPDTFNLALGLQDRKFDQFLNEKMYKIRATQQTLVKVKNEDTGQYENKWTFDPLKMSVCKKENFQVEGTQDYFLKIPYQTMYCFDTAEDKAVIEGEFSADIYKAVVIEFLECIGEGCASDEEKKEFLDQPTLGLFMSNKIIQITEKENPEKPMGKNLYWLSGPTFQKYITLNLVNNYINSDFGYYGKSVKKQRVVTLSSSAEVVVPRITTGTESVMFKLTVVYEKNREINYYRKYLKIDEAFSQLGGMFNALLTIGFVICQPFSQLELNRKLLNSIFNISEEESGEQNNENKDDKDNDNNKDNNNEKNKIQRDVKTEVQLEQVNSTKPKLQKFINNIRDELKFKGRAKSSSDFSKMKNQEMLDIIKKNAQNQDANSKKQDLNSQVKSFFSLQFSELQIKFKDYLFNYLSYFKCFQTKKQRLITYGTNKLYTQVDIFHIINKMIEIEKLKHLLLNDNQIKLFEYLPRPKLRVDEIYEEEDEIKNQKSKQQNPQQINSLVDDDLTVRSKQSKRTDKIKQFTLFGEEERSQLEKAQEAQKAFHQILRQQGQRSHVDDKLIKMLDPKLMNLFIENSFDFGPKKQDDNYSDSAKLDDSIQKDQYLRPKKKSLFNKSEILGVGRQQQMEDSEDMNSKTKEPFDQLDSSRIRSHFVLSPKHSTREDYYKDDCDQSKKMDSCYALLKHNSVFTKIPTHQQSTQKIEPKNIDEE